MADVIGTIKAYSELSEAEKKLVIEDEDFEAQMDERGIDISEMGEGDVSHELKLHGINAILVDEYPHNDTGIAWLMVE